MTTDRTPTATRNGRDGRSTRRREVRYPDSDGKPMAESEIHRDEMMRTIQTLQDAMAARPDVYVSGNMLCYYEEGNPRRSVAPDVFVAKGAAKHRRRIYKMWEEPPITVVFEVTSPSTRREDLVKKRDLYARLGVREYFLYDPLAEYLRPSLQGFRLDDGVYQPIEPDAEGALVSEELGLRLLLVDGLLRLTDLVTGATLLSPPERAAIATAAQEVAESRADASARARDSAEARVLAEVQAREAAERRIAELEARLAQREQE